MTQPAATAPLRFGRFELQPHERRLLVDGAPATLGARAFDLLLALAERPGRLVSKRALFELVWPGLVVQENNLAAQMSALRKVVGDEVIATIPGRGYRFVARFDSAREATPDKLPSMPPSALPTRLPAELAALLGRSDELAGLLAAIDAHRLVTIVGPGGIGKSLLAQHLLHARERAYPQGVCWVELGSVLDGAQLPGAVIGALGLHGSSSGDPVQALLHALAPLSMLLALDNAEHLLDEVAHFTQTLHARCPQLRIVVTSQAPLKLAAERVHRIEPLAVPEAAVPAQQALRFGAVALFVQRVQAIDARFELRDDNAAAVIELCRALDGLPLALELAAARVPLLGVAPLLQQMSQRLQLLSASRDRAAPPRQSALRAALDWSHGLLEAREQQVFRRLGVMVGSAALALIQPVVADGAVDAWAVLDALDVLIDRSLVAVLLPNDARGAPRYRLLESPRHYALERLADSAEQEALRQRHARAMAALCDGAYARCFSGEIGNDAWVDELAPDFDNARDALAWARATGDAATELTIAATLLRALPASLHAERMALADACEVRLTRDDTIDESLHARVCIELACAWADTQKGRARDVATRALELARRLDATQTDRFMLYHALSRTASAAAQAGDPLAAQAALAELRRAEDPAWPAQRLLWGAEAAQVVARLSGDAQGTLQRSRRLVALDRARGSNAATALGNLIDHELAAGDAAAAAQTGAALVAALLGTRDEYNLAFARINLCAACLALGDCPRARAVAQDAWPQAIAFELQHAAASYLALLAALEGRPRAAAQLLGFTVARYAACDESPEANEALALQRAQSLAAAALGDAALQRARADGAQLHERDIAALAFGHADA